VEKPLKTYQAAGGVVLDQAGRLLLIERTIDGEYEIRLPKGHIEPGEAPEAAACREVCEETGYCDLRIERDLGWATIAFETEQHRVVRDERYYVMRLASDRRQPPQFQTAQEALYHNRWVSGLDDAEALLTFEAEKAVVRRARAAQPAVD
jgi:8-oxo-dGTP pyrophosphatase MutT (NUDIX family)